MSAVKKPGGDLPPPIDPNNVQDVCADEVLSIQIGGGICTLEFGKRRYREVPNGDPVLERVVVNRLVLAHSALDDMMNKLLMMNRAAQQHQMLRKSDTGRKN